MAGLIGSTYELLEQIGSGGGGVVYLGRHTRLDKSVVLKADKRTLTAKPEALRREVDALKNLNHTYIPQVYDFIAEDNTVYTVMDYIEGESLDKPLKRGERFSQPQVIEWSCQLLEALCYLHSRLPHGILHGDIKPANIMLTPQNDIRLIDFNIALALGEEGAVRVGFSQGYASPEHYGTAFPTTVHPVVIPETEQLPPVVETERLNVDRTENQKRQAGNSANGGSSGYGSRGVLLDVRSDIYSLGATLYHLLTGKRPAKDARDVEPIMDVAGVSPAIAAIIQKAMSPDPNLRYQTAAEMLDAFRHLRENDPRTRRFRRTRNIAAACVAVVCLLGAGLTFTGLRLMERAQAAAAQEAKKAEETARQAEIIAQQGQIQEQAAKEALAAVREAESAYTEGNLALARSRALDAMWDGCPYYAQAQKILTDALGVYDLSDGLKAHCVAELPSETLKLALSPEGGRLAALYAYEAAVFDSETGQNIATLPTRPTALCDLVFLGEDVLLYAGEDGLTAYDVAAGKAIWQSEPATRVALSQDGTRAAGVLDQEEQALIYDTADGTLYRTVSFQGRRQSIPADGGILADPEDALLALNADGSMLAASFEDGGLCVYDVETGEEYEILASSDYTHMEGGFYQNYFAFSAWNTGECVFLIYDMAELVQIGGFEAQVPFLAQTDANGICVASGNLLVEIDPTTGEQRELAYASADITGYSRAPDGTVLVATAGGEYALFNRAAQPVTRGSREDGCEFLAATGPFVALGSRETPTIQILKMETHPEAQLCSYPPDLAHTEARVSADGTRVMLFRYDSFTLFTRAGEELCRAEIPDAMEVYDQQFRRDEGGSYLEVLYRDGRMSAYSAQDGGILWEKQGEVPGGDLSETFETSRWRIESSPHGAPQVYDKETGALYRELEQDSYLTYVTEAGDYLALQYLSAQGERYGLLMNQEFETLAYLPGLCDVVNGTLVFDGDMGNLRQSRIYSPQELIALAET